MVCCTIGGYYGFRKFCFRGGINPYPIGSIYISTNDTSPAELFGGTWQQIKDVFLLASGDSYEAGSTGGEASVVLTRANMPDYVLTAHFMSDPGVMKAYGCEIKNVTYAVAIKQELRTGGSDEPHNNMPPYLSVYCWERIE